MKSRILTVFTISVFVLSGILYSAETPAPKKEQITREAMQANKKAIVAQNMMLTAEQEKIFWPMYDDYQIGINKLNAARMDMLKKFSINYDRMSNELATELLDSAIEIEKTRLSLKRELVEKFGKKFPPKIVARYFQIENKMEAGILAEAAGQIPLAK